MNWFLSRSAVVSVVIATLCILGGCSAPADQAQDRGSATPGLFAGPVSPTSSSPPVASSTPDTSSISEAPVVGVDGLPCFDAPWIDLVQTDCDGDAYLLAGASTDLDAQWCSVAQGYPVKALAVSSLDGVLCFLHLEPPTPVVDAAAYGELSGKCLAGGQLLPRTVSCNQELSVLVTGVASANDACPTPTLPGVMAWSVPDPAGQVVCLQRYVAEDSPSFVVPMAGPRWPSSLVIPDQVMRTSSPFRAGLDYAPPSWSSPGAGYSVMCADGTLSNSGGRRGACSWHGGVG
jgi:hypothetical protein